MSIGDLIELSRVDNGGGRQLYLGPPSYVRKAPGQYLLLGVRPNGVQLVDESVGAVVQYERHMRLLSLKAEIAPPQLHAAGLNEICRAHWLKHPGPDRALTIVDVMRQRLDEAAESGQIDGLTVLDPEMPVTYYRGRWRAVSNGDSGDFVGRRPQAYGADLWCLVRIEQGVPRALLDLPLDDPAAAGCDEAWRFQAAIDAVRGQPQLFRVRSTPGAEESRVLDLFGPVPGWAQRYLELAGTPVSRTAGALLCYRAPTSEIDELSAFFADMLWMHITLEGAVE
ncbi:hypothetical protein [Nonomuraea sp. 3-1Str]|uniref:hypothetical protein n=1 Tax=Nonomuraea sp. 3-1Str TaxID=2929801 RepID=UPI00286FC96D|nr:hypothetical protein [Nonomuraea sp. 3-1Str]